MIDHARRAIIEYDESELRTGGIARGWADVAGLGVQPEVLERMRPTGRSEVMASFTFREHQVPARGGEGGVHQLWWSNEAAAPLRVSSTAQRSTIVVHSLQTRVDESLLQDPRNRFSTYSVMDVADFREQHHEEGKSGALNHAH